MKNINDIIPPSLAPETAAPVAIAGKNRNAADEPVQETVPLETHIQVPEPAVATLIEGRISGQAAALLCEQLLTALKHGSGLASGAGSSSGPLLG